MTAAAAATYANPRQVWKRRVAKYSRWLHIYLSMFSCIIVLFFAVTGVTLNRPEWFASAERVNEITGTMSAAMVQPTSGEVDRLAVAEFLRGTHQLTGAVADLRVDDAEIAASFKGPGYSADVFIDRTTGKYQATERRLGLVAVANDLHKGRDSGASWRLLIDISALFLTFVSLTGLVLLYFVHKHRVVGFTLLGVGGAVSYGIYLALVP